MGFKKNPHLLGELAKNSPRQERKNERDWSYGNVEQFQALLLCLLSVAETCLQQKTYFVHRHLSGFCGREPLEFFDLARL